MPILLTCECGKQLKVSDESAGKRVRCPTCKAILQAPAKSSTEDAAPAPKAMSRPAPVEDDRADDEPPRKPAKSKSRDDDEKPRKAKSRDDEEDDRPRKAKPRDEGDEDDDRPRKRDKSRKGPPGKPAAKPSSSRLLVLIGVGVLLLAGGGVAIWLMTRDDGAGITKGGNGPAASKDQLVGIWQTDIDATKAANPQTWQRAFKFHVLELKKDGSFRQMLNFQAPIEPDKGTWKIVQQDKVTFKVELTRPNSPNGGSQIWLAPKGADTLFHDPRAAGFPSTVMKRVQQFPTPADGEPVNPKPPVEPKKPAAEPVKFPPRVEFTHGAGEKESERAILEMRLSRDGRRLVLWNQGSGDGAAYTGKVQIWDVAGEPKKLKEHPGSLHAMSPDGSRLLCCAPGSLDQCVMEADTGKVIAKIGDRFGELVFQSNDTIWELQSRSDAGGTKKKVEIFRFDANTGKRTSHVVSTDGRGYFAPAFQDSADFHYITRFYNILAWDSVSQKMKKETPLLLKKSEKIDIDNSDVAVSSDGRWMVTTFSTRDKVSTRAFDLTNLANSKDIPFDSVFQHQFVPGRHLVLNSMQQGADKSEVQAFDLGENRVVARFVGVEHATPKLVISADGSTLAVANAKGKVQIWDLKQLK